ncbi:SixA phosphatase family protein [Roseibium sp. SCP14]|uniref:SixA phosphatase family protein n=1 Tax=Roseibium sp. SCP14 TaxID=3141375 RepID=UPI003336F31C
MRLLLLRHAKSDWGDPSLADIDRPLNRRGKSAAVEMSRYMKTERLLPNRILCSTSQRTRETLAKLLPYLQQETQILLLSDLYRQSEDDYTDLIRKHGSRAQNLMIIGHNPATEETAFALAGTGNADAMNDLQVKYPTAALSVIDFDISDWSDLKPKTGHLERFVKPRDL